MKTGFDVLDILYKVVNDDSVTSIIDGRVYRRRKKANSELQDIVLIPLTTAKGDDVQTATVIINMYCANFQYGLQDETKLRQITDTVITVLEAYTITDGVYFDLDLRSVNTMQDTDQPTMSYTSLRVNCTIQKL